MDPFGITPTTEQCLPIIRFITSPGLQCLLFLRSFHQILAPKGQKTEKEEKEKEANESQETSITESITEIPDRCPSRTDAQKTEIMHFDHSPSTNSRCNNYWTDSIRCSHSIESLE